MAEFAAIGMSYLALPSLVHAPGDVFDAEDTERITRNTLQDAVMQWLPSIAVVDAFAHWIFADAPADVSPDDLDLRWRELGQRFMPWIDWTGLQQEGSVGWRSEWSFWRTPFYGLAYGVAHLGALDLWRAAQHDAPATWRQFREALALGGSKPLSMLFNTAGVGYRSTRQWYVTLHRSRLSSWASMVARHENDSPDD
jgi:oligoendopeptidase F